MLPADLSGLASPSDILGSNEEMAHIQQKNGNLNGALDLLNQAAGFSSNEQTEYKGLIELKKAILYAQLDDKNNAIEAIKTAHKYKVFDDQRVFNLFVKEKALDKLHNVKKYEKLIKEIRRGKANERNNERTKERKKGDIQNERENGRANGRTEGMKKERTRETKQ